MTTLYTSGTDTYNFHPCPEQGGAYIIYPRAEPDRAVAYRPQMVKRGDRPCGPTWLTADEIDALGKRLFG